MTFLSRELKNFCDYYKLEFPDFNVIRNIDNSYKCTITWYNDLIILSDFYMDQNNTVLNALNKLNIWLNNDMNFIHIVTLSKKYYKV